MPQFAHPKPLFSLRSTAYNNFACILESRILCAQNAWFGALARSHAKKSRAPSKDLLHKFAFFNSINLAFCRHRMAGIVNLPFEA